MTRRMVTGAALAATLVLGAGAASIPSAGGDTSMAAADSSTGPGADEPAHRRVTLAFSGDTLIHGAVLARAAVNAGGVGYDFGPMFDLVRDRITAADLAVCHLEVPLDTDHVGLRSYPVFNSPPEVAVALAGAGYDGCSVASNHAMDAGEQGITTTIEALEAAGLGHDGTARSERERDTPTLYRTATGVMVGHVSATYGLNGIDPPPGKEWLADRIDVDRIVADADAARAAGADLVVVSLHWGVEYRTEPTAEQRRVAEALAASGSVDLLVGHHAHVVQPIERIGDLVVVFGLGNFLSNQSAECCPARTQDGVLVQVEMVEYAHRFEVRALQWTPTWVDRGPFTIVPVSADSNDPVLAASAERTDSTVGPGAAAVDAVERAVAARAVAALGAG